MSTGADTGERERLRAEVARLDRLLDEVRASSGPVTWSRVEELVRGVMAMHGAALARALAYARAAGAGAAELDARIVEDELVSSLLLLHEIHPVPCAERIRRALDELTRTPGGVDAVLIDEAAGRVRVRVDGFPVSRTAEVEALVRRTVEDAAPEVESVVVEGTGTAPPPEPLVQIRRPVRREDGG